MEGVGAVLRGMEATVGSVAAGVELLPRVLPTP